LPEPGSPAPDPPAATASATRLPILFCWPGGTLLTYNGGGAALIFDGTGKRR